MLAGIQGRGQRSGCDVSSHHNLEDPRPQSIYRRSCRAVHTRAPLSPRRRVWRRNQHALERSPRRRLREQVKEDRPVESEPIITRRLLSRILPGTLKLTPHLHFRIWPPLAGCQGFQLLDHRVEERTGRFPHWQCQLRRSTLSIETTRQAARLPQDAAGFAICYCATEPLLAFRFNLMIVSRNDAPPCVAVPDHHPET
jgi:hypothetical protein